MAVNAAAVKTASATLRNTAMEQEAPADTILQGNLKVIREMEHAIMNNTGMELSQVNTTAMKTYFTAMAAALS